MKCLIIEDEFINYRRLRSLLQELYPDIEVEERITSVSEGITYFSDSNVKKVDLIFADICLPDGKSFDIFEKTGIPAPVIFTTGFEEYADRVSEYNAIDYLLKPIHKEKLDRAVKSVMKASSSYHSRLLLKTRTGYRMVKSEDISLAYIDGQLVYVVTDKLPGIAVVSSLDAFVTRLNPDMFCRVTRYHIVNVDRICDIRNYDSKKKTIVLEEPHFEIHITNEKFTELKSLTEK